MDKIERYKNYIIPSGGGVTVSGGEPLLHIDFLIALFEELKKKGCDAYYFPSFEEIENFCLDKCQKGDVLITMGAGNVVNIGENLLKR